MPVQTEPLARHAIVIGGSMAGLLVTRVLSDHFERVTLIERDKVNDVPEVRKGQPQIRHLHALLARGFQIMSHYFPDLPQELEDGGAVLEDIGSHMRWHCYGGYRMRFELGVKAAYMSRPFLEWLIRRRVLALPNVTLLDASRADELVTTDDRRQVTGVHITRRGEGNRTEVLTGDLVVDACGRGSAAPKWLETLGYSRPDESVVTINVGYATRLYRRDPTDPMSRDWFFLSGEPPHTQRGGGAFPVEGDRWLVTLAGTGKDHPPADETGFVAFARSLSALDIYDLISRSEPLSEIVLHTFPSSLRRHYEKLTRFPEGYLVVGDAICSFNPIYGQGMTSAALQATELDSLLQQQRPHGRLQGLSKVFFQRAAKVVDTPWRTAVGEDFRFPETIGKKPPGTDLINAYLTQVHRATLRDPIVCAEFLRVLGMLQPPSTLFHPRVVWRALKSSLRKPTVPILRPTITLPEKQ